MAYIQKLRNVRYYETIFDLLARQYEVAKIDEAREGSIIQVVDTATVPDHHSSPLRMLIILGFFVLGLIFSFVWVLASESIERISRNPTEKVRLDLLRQSFHKAKS